MRAVEDRAYGSQQAPKRAAATYATALGTNRVLLAVRAALSVFRTHGPLRLNHAAELRAITCHKHVGGTLVAVTNVAATVPGFGCNILLNLELSE